MEVIGKHPFPFFTLLTILVKYLIYVSYGISRQSSQLATALQSAFQSHLHTYLYPHSTITVQVSVLSSDGSLFAAAINACTLALIDAGIPMPGLLCGCTAGMSGSASTPRDPSESEKDSLDPLLDLSLPEEQELPFITVGTTTPLPLGGTDDDEGMDDTKVSILNMETRAHTSYLETMLAVGIDGCKQIREILEGVIKGSTVAVGPTHAEEDNSSLDDDM